MEERKEFFKGTSRKSRTRKALAADHVKIDERTLPDLLSYAVKLARNVPFFDPKEDVNIRWSEFFSRNDLVQLIDVSSFQIENLEQEVNDQIERLYAVHDQQALAQTLNELSHIIMLIAQAINNLKKNLSLNEFTSDLIYYIGNSINGELKGLVTELYAYQDILQWKQHTVDIVSEINTSWGISSSGIRQNKKIDESTIDRFKEIFHLFFYVIKHLMKRSGEIVNKFLSELQNAEPHIALLLVFLRLFRYLQDFQNQLTERHLDFYYKDVLQMKPQAYVPDVVNICFQLKPGVFNLQLPKGTRLLAGKDVEGNKIIYTTNRDLNIAAAGISKLATIFLSRDPEYGRCINQFNYTAIYSRCSSPLSGEYTWAAFGEDQYDKNLKNRTLDWARLGFVISSDTLGMADGERNIEVILHCSQASFASFWRLLVDAGKSEPEGVYRNAYKILSTAFVVGVSTMEGIATIDHYSCTLSKNLSAIKIAFSLGATHPPVTVLPKSKAPENFPEVSEPFVQVLLNESCSLYLYSLLQLLKVEDVVIRVSVDESKNLKVYNNYGELTLQNPAQLFGPIPENDSFLLVGHQEAFQKNLVAFGLKLAWYQLPVQNIAMEKYFEAYGETIYATDYKLQACLLKNFTWFPAESQQPSVNLFTEVPVSEQESRGVIQKETVISLDLKKMNFQKEVIAGSYGYTPKAQGGFFKLTLKCPGFGFGHSSYAGRLSAIVVANAKLKKGEVPQKLPYVPFSPLLSQVRCSYVAQTVASKNKNEIQLYHIGPFGFEHVAIRSRQYPVNLLTQLEGRGVFNLGFDQYPVGGELSLLFRMNETFYEEVKGEVPKVSWYYLSNNVWKPLKDDDVVQDTTQGFLHDGIIQIKVPQEISKGNTLMDPGLLWLKAQIERAAVIRGHLSGIFVNAVDATWNGESSDAHLATALKTDTVSKPEIPIAAIAGIKQPGDSFAGRIAESKENWLLRVSERIRHKNRAITAKDFEELILDKFDIIFKAQCFMAHSSIERYKTVLSPDLPPGKVHIVVVPDVTNERVKDKLYPRLNGYSLMEIRDYLKCKASPFVTIEVTNPYYEPIKVHTKVKFDGERPDGYYLARLNTEILQFLSSWLYSEIKEEEFGISIYKSDVLGFVQNRPYVEFVTEFSLVRINYMDGNYDMYDSVRGDDGEEEIKPRFPWSIITSARQHDLKVIDETSFKPPIARSIDNMRLEEDFLLD